MLQELVNCLYCHFNQERGAAPSNENALYFNTGFPSFAQEDQFPKNMINDGLTTHIKNEKVYEQERSRSISSMTIQERYAFQESSYLNMSGKDSNRTNSYEIFHEKVQVYSLLLLILTFFFHCTLGHC